MTCCTPTPSKGNKRRKSSGSAEDDFSLAEYLQRKEAREREAKKEREQQRDEVTLFLLSLAPAMRRLSAERQSWLKCKIQGLVHEAEFGPAYSQQAHYQDYAHL